MTAMNYANSTSFNCSAAAVNSPAHEVPLLDTAVIPAVSISICPLLRILGLRA